MSGTYRYKGKEYKLKEEPPTKSGSSFVGRYVVSLFTLDSQRSIILGKHYSPHSHSALLGSQGYGAIYNGRQLEVLVTLQDGNLKVYEKQGSQLRPSQISDLGCLDDFRYVARRAQNLPAGDPFFEYLKPDKLINE